MKIVELEGKKNVVLSSATDKPKNGFQKVFDGKAWHEGWNNLAKNTAQHATNGWQWLSTGTNENMKKLSEGTADGWKWLSTGTGENMKKLSEGTVNAWNGVTQKLNKNGQKPGDQKPGDKKEEENKE